MYLHERDNLAAFKWDAPSLTAILEEVSRKQGLLYGRLSLLGFDSKLKAMAENLTHDVVYSSEIEGVRLNVDEVRSSIARRLGIENVKCTAPSHYVDSVVAVLLEAMRDYNLPLSKNKLCAWQAAFFPSGYSEGAQIEIGKYRTHEEHIVSGMMGRERIHYIAPAPERVEEEMKKFLEWFNGDAEGSSVVRSAIAHLWFLSIHPFEDGNGRLADFHYSAYLCTSRLTSSCSYRAGNTSNPGQQSSFAGQREPANFFIKHLSFWTIRICYL